MKMLVQSLATKGQYMYLHLKQYTEHSNVTLLDSLTVQLHFIKPFAGQEKEEF